MARAENLAIMFVDMAGYAERTARQSREQNKAMLRDFNGLLLPLIARFGGRRVKSIGDALLVTFRSPTDGVRCGMAMHDAVAYYNAQRPEQEPLRIRVALNVGEVRIERDDVFGEAVNIAARVEELTPPGEVYLTGVTYLSMNKAEVPAEHVGEQLLKGIPEAVRLFRVPPHKLTRLTPAGESLEAVRGELPYGGLHVLPADSDIVVRLAEALRRAPYVDWRARVRALPLRPIMLGIAAVVLAGALVAEAYWFLQLRPPPAPSPAPVEVAATLPPPPVAVNAEAREALAEAHSDYFERRRVEAARGYARVLEMDPNLRHDSGLAANLVGTLGWSSLAMETIRKYPSAELVYELARRTGQPGRIGAQRAATLLEEQGQERRIDRAALALNELKEAADCPERLAAVRSLRTLKETRAVPILRDMLRRSFKDLFRGDPNACMRQEAEEALAELEKVAGASRT